VVLVVVGGSGVIVVLVVEGEIVVVVVVSAPQGPASSGTSARIGTTALSTPSNVTTSESSEGSFRTTTPVPLAAALPVAKVRIRSGCSDRSRATPSS
jgi:hypothetical protein